MLTGLDDQLNDLMKYIPEVASSCMVRWKKENKLGKRARDLFSSQTPCCQELD